MGKQKRSPKKRLSNRKVALIIVLTACLNIIIALGALIFGLWLDDKMAWRGIATVTLLVISFPLSILLMVRLALILIKKWSKSANPYVVDDPSQEKEE